MNNGNPYNGRPSPNGRPQGRPTPQNRGNTRPTVQQGQYRQTPQYGTPSSQSRNVPYRPQSTGTPPRQPKKSTNINLYVAIGVIAILVIGVLLGILFSGSDGNAEVTVPEATYTESPDADKSGESSVPTATPHISDTAAETPVTDAPVPEKWEPILAKTHDAGKEYTDKIVFLGDSTTYGLRYYAMLDGGKNTTQVWTPRSGTLALFNVSTATIVYPETDEEITIKEALSRKQPEYLVITLGVNGIASMNENTFKISYKWLIDTVKAVSPETRIICQTMFPVASNYESLGAINNEKIQNGNRWILDVASENEVKFLDTYSVLVGEDGWLPAELQNGDGLHLNADGFEIELNNIRTHAYID